MAKIAFLGLGQMGAPMATRLLQAGHELTVWNRTPDRAKPLAAGGATVAGSPAEAGVGSTFAITMLATPEALTEVVLGEQGLAKGLAPSQSAPAEFRGDVLEDAFEHVGVVVHTQLVRDREEQRIGDLDSLVAREFLHQHLGFRGVRATKDGPRVRVDVADLVPVAGVATEVRPVAVVHEREDAAADRHAWLTPVSGVLPRLTIGFNLLALLYVQRLAGLIIFERRTLKIHAQSRGPRGRRVGTRTPPNSLAQSF